MKRYVIIGFGAAAVGCIEGIRSIDPAGEITVISEEKHPAYCRPLISYYLEDKTSLEKMPLRDEDFYKKNACRTLLGVRAERIDPIAHNIALSDGTLLSYDCLCVAAGSSPFVPPFEGLDSVPMKSTFMTVDDAVALKESVKSDTRVLIVGAGLIGLKCAEGLFSITKNVSVCDLASRVLSSILDADAAAIMQKHLEKQGLRFWLGDSAARFEKNRAIMNSGREVIFDQLVLAVGVRANTGLLAEIGAEVHRGIVVDEGMRTSLQDIYAAGDCTEALDISSGEKKVMAIMPSAALQGWTAGVNMAGGSAAFDKGIPMNSIGFFGLHAMTAGCYEGECFEEKTDHTLKRLFVRDGLLKGFMLIGLNERAGIYTSLIRERTPLKSVDFELMKKYATTAAFSQNIRRKKFSEVV